MNRAELITALDLCRPCLSNHALVPMLSHFCFDKSFITAFNGTQAVITAFESELNCGVPGELFYRLMNSYQTEDVEVLQKEKEVTIKAGSNNAKLSTIPETDFVFDLPELESLSHFPINMKMLTGLNSCLMSVSDNPMQKNLYGVTVKNNKRGLNIYSTDLKTLSCYNAEPVHGKDFTLLLPKLFTGLLIVFGKSYKEGTFYLGEDFVCVDFGDTLLYSKVLTDIDFLDFETEINRHINDGLVFQEVPESLAPAIDRSLIFVSSEIDQFARVSIDSKKMEIYTNGPFGDSLEKISLKKPLPKMEFKMDVGLLQKGVLVSKELVFTKSESDYVFIGKGKEEGFLHLILTPEEE